MFAGNFIEGNCTAMMANRFAAHWAASGSSLCLGHWEIGYLEQMLGMDPERKK